MKADAITVETTVEAPIGKAWACFTNPDDIMQWNQASDDWHCPAAENDLKQGGRFSYTMAAKDGSFQFDFWGTYDAVEQNKLIAYTMGDGRQAEVHFSETADGYTHITETFDAEDQNPRDMQQMGWQAILNSFRDYCEGL